VACGCVFAASRLGIVWRIAAAPFTLSKRVVDIVLALGGIVVLAPVLTIAFLATVVSSPGPALFRRRSIGRHGKPFDVFKFRTMAQDSPELRQLLESDPVAAADWATNRKLAYDPRITATGYTLRITSIDELPQLFNILKGDMSLVDLRPMKLETVDDYPTDKIIPALQDAPRKNPRLQLLRRVLAAVLLSAVAAISVVTLAGFTGLPLFWLSLIAFVGGCLYFAGVIFS
jgi:hypothetical protein